MPTTKAIQVVIPLAVIALMATLAPGFAQSTPSARAQTRIEAFTRPSSDLELAFSISGTVMQTLVEPGERVKAGQPLIRLDDREARIRMKLHELRSRSTAAVDAATATLNLQIEELESIKEAREKDGVNIREVARQELEVERARASLLIEELKREESELEYQAAAVNLEKYTLTAPVDGFVEILLPRAGETVEALTPILRLVTTDPLEIEAAVPARDAVRITRGSSVWVSLDLEGYEKFRPATVRSLSQVADGATSKRRVLIEMPNPDALPAGILATIRLDQPHEDALARTE